MMLISYSVKCWLAVYYSGQEYCKLIGLILYNIDKATLTLHINARYFSVSVWSTITTKDSPAERIGIWKRRKYIIPLMLLMTVMKEHDNPSCTGYADSTPNS